MSEPAHAYQGRLHGQLYGPRLFVCPGAKPASRRRRALSALVFLVPTLLAALGWTVLLRPVSLGGNTGYVMVRGVSMLPTYRGGDLVITHRQATYRKGEIIAYKVPKGEFGGGTMVIHRITGGDASNGYEVTGDNNNGVPDPWRPHLRDIVGRAWLHVPRLGNVLGFLHAPLPLAALATGIAVAFMLVPKDDEKKPKRS